MTDKTLAYANKILDRLIELDAETISLHYDMGQLLYAIFAGQLWNIMNYDSFAHMVEEELSFAPTTAHSYRKMYGHFKRLSYNKEKALQLIKKFSYTQMSRVMPQMKSSMGDRAIKARIAGLDQNQINFTLTNAQLAAAHKALHALGATRSEEGRYKHSSEAFMSMVKEVNARPKLKVVA